LKIAGANGESHTFAKFSPLFLKWGGSTQRGIKGQVIGFAVCRAGLNVPPAFAVGVRVRTAPAVAARNSVQRVVNFSRGKYRTDLYFFAPSHQLALMVSNTVWGAGPAGGWVDSSASVISTLTAFFFRRLCFLVGWVPVPLRWMWRRAIVRSSPANLPW